MNRLEQSVLADLAAAPAPPPIERVRTRARMQRARGMSLTALPLIVIAVAVGLAISAARAHDPVRVGTASSTPKPTAPLPSTTTTTTRPLPAAVAALPIATEQTVPGLATVERLARDEQLENGVARYAEIVATTQDKVVALFGSGPPPNTGPIYVLRLVGHFVCNACSSVSAAAAAPKGDQILLVIDRTKHPIAGTTFGLGDHAVDLSAFGRVYRVPVVRLPPASPLPPVLGTASKLSARIVLPSPTIRAGSQMRATVVVDNETGQPLRFNGCGEPFQVALGTDMYQPAVAWTLCLEQLSIPAGETRYTVNIVATYTECSGDPSASRMWKPGAGQYHPTLRCLANGSPPPLPVGNYRAKLYEASPIVPEPAPIAVRVTP